MTTDVTLGFDQLDLKPALLSALKQVGYETPSPIQAQTIPFMLQGRDVLGQAQTGTGKTAAFALPILSRIDLKPKNPQVLVLAPTRELAIQVAEAFQKYASKLNGFHVLPIYGGQDYRGQIRALKRGVHVVVGTPGRVMDHMRRGTLTLENLATLVLDEADEMLRMGFIDDVEWVLEQTPPTRQIALFSATMPQQIRRIANSHLNDPAEVTIKVKTSTAETIRQRYLPVSGGQKLDALTRILEAEPFDGILIFVRTKTITLELAERLQARGYAASAINGDIQQKQRERTIKQLKDGKIDVLIATDVAARGLDVERISHVINYDIPYDTESYVHRIGRTGRAGREGDAILFVAPRERRMLSAIERATRKQIEKMELPSTDIINEGRIARFKQRITDTLEKGDLGMFKNLVDEYLQESDHSAEDVAAALARIAQGETSLLVKHAPQPSFSEADSRRGHEARSPRGKSAGKSEYGHRGKGARSTDSREPGQSKSQGSRGKKGRSDVGLQSYRIEVGHDHEVQPGNIVGAIANEADIDSQYIGQIKIFDDHSVVDLPEGMPKSVLKDLRKVWVAGRQLNITRFEPENTMRTPTRRKAKSPQPHNGDAAPKKRKSNKKPAGSRDTTSGQ